MQVEFHGAAGEVTGSMHLVQAAGRRVLLDCGMIQGGREAEAHNFDPFPFDPTQLDALVISHAHIDHIGRVPLLAHITMQPLRERLGQPVGERLDHDRVVVIVVRANRVLVAVHQEIQRIIGALARQSEWIRGKPSL